MSILITTCWSDTYGVRADWAEASAYVASLDADGEWHATGKQVANFAHDPMRALRAQLEEAAINSGGLGEDAEAAIEVALSRARRCAEPESEPEDNPAP